MVTNIVPERTDFKWDFEVPRYHNYWCAGAIHHNSGKTSVGAGIVSRLVRREGPIYRRLRNPEKRPLKIWIAPQTFEKFKSNWEQRVLGDIFEGMKVDYTESPVRTFTWADEISPTNTIYGKTQDQGFRAFESDVIDLCLFDEEPEDRRVHDSAVRGTATTNGVVVYTMTPLLGISWTFSRFYQPVKKAEYQIADRVWRCKNLITLIQMGSADNPANVAGGGVARVANDPGLTQAEKNTRLYGHYGYAEGAIFPEFAGLTVEAE